MYNTPVCVHVHEPLRVGRESSHEIKELLNLLPLVLKARYPSGSAFRWNLSSGCHSHLGLVVENKINHNFQIGSALYAGLSMVSWATELAPINFMKIPPHRCTHPCGHNSELCLTMVVSYYHLPLP